MSYEIHSCSEKNFDGVFKINVESNLFATAQFITSPMTIERTVKNKKKLFLVAECLETNETVGYIIGKMKTTGVFYNELLGVKKEHRRKGIGGGLIIALLKLLNIEEINGLKNNFSAWKWFADVPTYNYEALQMYKSMSFTTEGIMKKHTRAKTDIHIMSFFLDEKKIPEYGKHVSHPANILDKTIKQYLQNKLKIINQDKTKNKKTKKPTMLDKHLIRGHHNV